MGQLWSSSHVNDSDAVDSLKNINSHFHGKIHLNDSCPSSSTFMHRLLYKQESLWMSPLTQARKKEKRTASLHAYAKWLGVRGEPTVLAFSSAKCIEFFHWCLSGFSSACVNPKLLLIKVSFFKVVEVVACIDGDGGFSSNYETEIDDIPSAQVLLDRQGKSRGEKDGEGSKNNGEFHCEKLWGV